ncbi:MAG TPA: ATP-binding protein [Dehalococcoidia bacterium]|nr:ATP-binding protein [Dehalococcoidia bacterium]
MTKAADQPDPNVVLVRDARQRALLRELIGRLPAVVAIVGGADHRLQYLNRAAAGVFGDRARLGLPLAEALPELQGQALLAALDAVQQSGEPVAVEQCRLQLRRAGAGDVDDRYFTLMAQPLRDPDGALLGSAVHAVEITAQVAARQAAEQLAEENAALYEQAAAVLRLRDELLNTLAHDFRAPLTAIQTGLQLLERQAERGEGLTSERVAAVIEPVGAAATRLNAMLSDLEDLARAESGRVIELRRARVDLQAVVAQAAAIQRLSSPRHTLAIAASGPPLVGQWDGPRLERVVANLLGNAIRYSPDGGPIDVSLSRDPVRGEAVLTISDSGIGIPAADLPRVFERFYRSPAVAGRIRGNGLGLASVREIVEQHGGQVEIASVEGAGTTVTVRLPLA